MLNGLCTNGNTLLSVLVKSPVLKARICINRFHEEKDAFPSSQSPDVKEFIPDPSFLGSIRVTLFRARRSTLLEPTYYNYMETRKTPKITEELMKGSSLKHIIRYILEELQNAYTESITGLKKVRSCMEDLDEVKPAMINLGAQMGIPWFLLFSIALPVNCLCKNI